MGLLVISEPVRMSLFTVGFHLIMPFPIPSVYQQYLSI
jgi:hypothetical protein